MGKGTDGMGKGRGGIGLGWVIEWVRWGKDGMDGEKKGGWRKEGVGL